MGSLWGQIVAYHHYKDMPEGAVVEFSPNAPKQQAQYSDLPAGAIVESSPDAPAEQSWGAWALEQAGQAAIPVAASILIPGGPLVKAGVDVAAEGINQAMGITPRSLPNLALAAVPGPLLAGAGAAYRGVKSLAKRIPGGADVMAEEAYKKGQGILAKLMPGPSSAQIEKEILGETEIPLTQFTKQAETQHPSIEGMLPRPSDVTKGLTKEGGSLLMALAPPIPSENLYAVVKQFNPPVNVTPYQTMVQGLLEQRELSQPLTGKLESTRLDAVLDQALATMQGTPGPAATFQQVRASQRAINAALDGAEGVERGTLMQMKKALTESLESSPIAGEAGAALKAANAAARKEYAVADLADIVQGKAGHQFAGGEMVISGATPLKAWQEKIRTDPLFSGSFTPAEQTSIGAYLTNVAEAPGKTLTAPYGKVSKSMASIDEALSRATSPAERTHLEQLKAVLERDVSGGPGEAIGRMGQAKLREEAVGEVGGMLEKGKIAGGTPAYHGAIPLDALQKKLGDPTFGSRFSPGEKQELEGFFKEIASIPSLASAGETSAIRYAVRGSVGGGAGYLAGFSPAVSAMVALLAPEAIRAITTSKPGRAVFLKIIKQNKDPSTFKRILAIASRSALQAARAAGTDVTAGEE